MKDTFNPNINPNEINIDKNEQFEIENERARNMVDAFDQALRNERGLRFVRYQQLEFAAKQINDQVDEIQRLNSICAANNICTRCGKKFIYKCRCHLGTKYDTMTCRDACKEMTSNGCIFSGQRPADYVGDCELLDPKDGI